MKFIVIGGILLFLILSHMAFAQIETSEIPAKGTDSVPKAQELNLETLTLEQAIAFALKHAPTMGEAFLTVALAELDLKQTQLWRRLIPSLTLHQGYNPVVGENRFGIGLSLDLNRLWEEHSKAQGAKLKWFNASIYRKTVRNQVIVAVTKTYYDFVTAKKQVELLEEQLQTHLKLQELQQLQFESGTTQLQSLLSTMDAVAKTQLALLKAQAEVELMKLQLKREMGYNDVREEVGK